MADAFDPILYWSKVALEAHRRDFTYDDDAGKDATGRHRSSLQPLVGGPTRVSRAFAIVHLAMYDALFMADPDRFRNASPAFGKIAAYQEVLPPPAPGLSREAAVAGAAAVTVRLLFQDDFVEERLTTYRLHLVEGGQAPQAVEDGLAYGAIIGRMLADSRAADGSQRPDAAYRPFDLPGAFQPDPYQPDLDKAKAVGPTWGTDVRLFGAFPDTIAFVGPTEALGGTPPPPGVLEDIGAYLGAPDWTADRNLVRAKGAVPDYPGLSRTPEETIIGLFWGYDGARDIGVPPRLYNQCLHALIEQRGLGSEAAAVMLATANLGMADAGILAWREKYAYHVGRPVTVLRALEAGYRPGTVSAPTLPALLMPAGGPDKPDYRDVAAWLGEVPTAPSLEESDPAWAPLGLPVTNTVGRSGRPGARSLTPQFPAYPSGHATFGSVCFGLASEILKALGEPDNAEFEFVSDELDGSSIAADGGVRQRHVRRLSLAQAIHENALSRIYLGVHWQMDAVEGVRLGRCIAEAIKANPTGPALALSGAATVVAAAPAQTIDA